MADDDKPLTSGHGTSEDPFDPGTITGGGGWSTQLPITPSGPNPGGPGPSGDMPGAPDGTPGPGGGATQAPSTPMPVGGQPADPHPKRPLPVHGGVRRGPQGT